MKSYRTMKRAALGSFANRRERSVSCIDQVVGDILSGWRYDISGLSPGHADRLRAASVGLRAAADASASPRTIDVLLISIGTLDRRLPSGGGDHSPRRAYLAHRQSSGAPEPDPCLGRISLEAVAVTGLVLSTLLWVLVAIATPLPGFLGEIAGTHPCSGSRSFHQGSIDRN